MPLTIYQASVQDIDIPTIINNIQDNYKSAKIQNIYTIEEIADLWQQTNNLQLFSNPLYNNAPAKKQETTTPHILIIHDIHFSLDSIKILNQVQNNNIQAIFLFNCKLPKEQTIIKIRPLPVNLKQKRNINYAKTVLSKYLSPTEIQDILPALLLPNSDYYINIQELNKLLKLLQLPDISKMDVIKNFSLQSQNIFNLTNIFLNAPINKTNNYIKTFLQNQDIHTLINMLKNNLQIIYLLKNNPVSQVAKELKKSQYYIQQLHNISAKYSKHQIYKILMLIFEFEINIRKGKYENPNQQFLLFILKIKALLQAATKS